MCCDLVFILIIVYIRFIGIFVIVWLLKCMFILIIPCFHYTVSGTRIKVKNDIFNQCVKMYF